MFMSLIQNRRSIRQFQNKPIEKEKINILIEAALRAPSSRSFNPWLFVVVQEKDMLQKLSCAKPHGSQFLKNAGLGIVVCADPAKCDVWIEDASIASIFIHLAAHDIGLGSCWIQIRERMYDQTTTSQEYIQKLLNIPENIQVESIIGIGYPDETKSSHKREDLMFDRIFYEKM